MAEYVVEYKDEGMYATCAKERVIRCRDCGYSITFNTGQMCCLRTSRFVDQHDFCSKAVEKWES